MCTYRTRAKEMRHLVATQSAHSPRGVRSGRDEWNIMFEGWRTEAARERERFSGLLLERKCATLWTRIDRGSLTNDPCHERGGQSSIDFYEEQKCKYIALHDIRRNFYVLQRKTPPHNLGKEKLYQLFTISDTESQKKSFFFAEKIF